MSEKSVGRVVLWFVLLILLVTAGSLVSTRIWGGKSEALPEMEPIMAEQGMSVAEFGARNNLPNSLLKEIFGLQSKADLEKGIDKFGLTTAEIVGKANRARVLAAEESTKNWIKIPLKFALWILFLAMVFVLTRRGLITPRRRKRLYLAALIVFGIALGSDPSAMGTVKDAIHLYANEGVIFPPRMVAFTIFLITVLIANKYICSWGCQVGALQDLIFRLGRNAKDTKGVLPQYKPPFALTNTVRVAFFILFILVAFMWGADMIDPIDPFKVYKPAALAAGGIFFLIALLVGSLFVYRPWCHFFCPFGLIGWLVEKISVFRIKVNYDTCIACEACARACPSTVMGAILKRDRVIPDCFACATCLDVCPTDSITFGAGRRQLPPAGHFDKKKKAPADDEK